MTAIKQLNDFRQPHVNNRKSYAFVKVLLYCLFTFKLPYFGLNKVFIYSLIIAFYSRSGILTVSMLAHCMMEQFATLENCLFILLSLLWGEITFREVRFGRIWTWNPVILAVDVGFSNMYGWGVWKRSCDIHRRSAAKLGCSDFPGFKTSMLQKHCWCRSWCVTRCQGHDQSEQTEQCFKWNKVSACESGDRYLQMNKRVSVVREKRERQASVVHRNII